MNSNLSNFNIANLFSDKKNGANPNFTGKLDIQSLFQNENYDENNYNFDSKILLDNIYEKREKLQKYYFGIFKKCCETIKSANKSGFTEIIYEIPKFSEHIGYSCKECIEYLKNKLQKQDLDVTKINSRTICISWGLLEDKLKEKEKEVEKKNTNINNLMQ
jgi:hypothetical protein